MQWKTGGAIMVSSLALALSGCGQAPRDGAHQGEGREEAMDAAEPPTGVSVTAAPGVAFAYHYAFSLPAARVAAAQESHATACEKLGVARCRITAMRYRLVGENDVEGMLTFKLDPALARAFGKQGIAAIEQAQGRLVDAEISGTDAGAEIARIGTERQNARDELARIDTQLARRDLPAAERSELQRQRGELVARIEAAQAAAGAQRESLATTPMTFDYRSGPAVRGFDASAPVGSAIDLLAGSAQATLAFVLGTLALLAPPGLVLAIGLLGWRWLRPRLPRKRMVEGAVEGAIAPGVAGASD